MKKFLVAGASTYGVKNAGDDAMFTNLVEGLRRIEPDCEIVFLARHIDEDFDKVYGVRSIKNFEHNNKEESLGRWFYGFNPGDSNEYLAAIRREIEACDVMIIGGNSFMEVSESSFMRGVVSYSALLATWAKFFGKPYVLYGVAAHPLANEYTKQVARFLCNNAAVVTVREEFTLEQLLAAGVDGKNIKVLADPAFGLQPVATQECGWKILEQEGISLRGKPILGIGFRHMYWKWDAKEFDEYAQKMATICDQLIEKLGVEVLFIPNCTYNVDTPNEDDRTIAEYVVNKMHNIEHVHQIKGDYYLPDLLSVFKVIDMLISNRRHSCVFGAIHKVPVVAMSTGHMWHFKPFMEELNLPDQIIDVVVQAESDIIDKCVETWQARASLSEAIYKNIPELCQKAHQHADEIFHIK